MTGLFLLLMAYRAMHARGIALSPLPLALAALAMGPVTAFVEYAWYEFATGLPAWRVAAANLHPEIMLRPAWWVAIVGLAVALAALLRRLPPLASLGRRAASGRA